ncbi:unnamed protein product [Nippostrongylus brasiliensis]|uniref:LP10272p (inferred by orthology to a D. melanogaster protein) n=1 Tax=Nippostrongylus brasiliensis TaxID=27835 RepID=A0A0N4YIW3_NIPBR|nr:unnamed protein product [Nippostrongylus brasiliensis]
MRRYLLSYHSTYVRNWRIIGAVWVLCALSTTVLQWLVLVHPAWIGSDEGGYIGLYNYCSTTECPWNVLQIRTLSATGEVAALLVLVSTILSSLAVFSIMVVLTMLAGCLLFPNGWDHARIREICDSKRYYLGLCQMRWPYLLALVLVVDQLTLTMLGFALTLKRPPKLPDLRSTAAPARNPGQPVPRPRNISLPESYYTKSSSRLDL